MRRVAAERSFPAGFLWGTATAAHQVEGDNSNCDWWEFEQQPGRIHDGDRSGIACDHYRRYREDFRILRNLHQNAHRLSVEWSRIEPNEGEFDSRQVRHYRDVLGELREQGMQPMLTLHHFTSPIWFAKKGGWAAPGAADAFMPFVRKVVDELGDLVAFWCTINEPNIYANQAYVAGEFAPGRKADLAGAYRVLGNMRRAHELAYGAIKKRRPDAPVGLSHHKFLFLPASRKRRDGWAAAAAQSVMDRWPLAPGRLQRTVDAPCDYVGLAHYWGQAVAFDPLRPGDQFIRRFNPPGAPETEMGWAADPRWMRKVLNELKDRGKPVYITENGLATHDDAQRQKYLRHILAQVLLAVEDGVDVRGYFHWTSMDNFEWARGYSQAFGLIEVDRKTMERRPKPSANLYSRIAQANALVD
jgi:beta-glucosidase